MQPFAGGAAFVDRSGAVVAADAGFLSRLALPAGDPTGALRARAESEPELRALLAGDGPSTLRLRRADGTTTELERVAADGGVLLVARAGELDEWLEHAMRSQGMGRVAGGIAHDIKNPLNAMSLQIALLGDKLSSSADASGTAASHLRALLDQIGRVNADRPALRRRGRSVGAARVHRRRRARRGPREPAGPRGAAAQRRARGGRRVGSRPHLLRSREGRAARPRARHPGARRDARRGAARHTRGGPRGARRGRARARRG